MGIYFVRGMPFDHKVMCRAGIVDLLLRRRGIAMAPLVIGILAGPTLEISLRQGLNITDDRFKAFFCPLSNGRGNAAKHDPSGDETR